MRKISSIVVIILSIYLGLSSLFSASVSLAQGTPASLALSPTSGTVAVGQTFDINIILNTGGQDTTATDVKINYNPQYLQVVDQNSSASGVQIGQGTIYPQYPLNVVDTTSGLIRISGAINASSNPIYYNGSGTLGTIRVRGVSQSSSVSLNFDFTLGSTIDCNVAGASGGDVLGSVINGNYTVGTGSCTPNCSGKSCGDDGCGGTCGSCSDNQICQNYQCVTSGTPVTPPSTIGDYIARAISSGMTVPLILVIVLVILATLSLYFLLKKKK